MGANRVVLNVARGLKRLQIKTGRGGRGGAAWRERVRGGVVQLILLPTFLRRDRSEGRREDEQ